MAANRVLQRYELRLSDYGSGMAGFTTERLSATPVSVADLPFLTRLWQDQHVVRWIGGVRTSEQVEALLIHDLGHWAEYGFGRWILSVDGVAVGHVKLEHWQNPSGIEDIEIGWALVPDSWGYGLATEAARAAIAFASERELAQTIAAFALIGNERSFRLMDALDFTYEVDFELDAGRARLYRRHLRATAR